MALTKIKLGKYIELYSQKCNIPNLTNDDVSGVNKDKEFFEPSNQVGGDTSKYKIVPPKYFACNLMHVGRDVVLPIAYNHSSKNKIVSPAYFVFRLINNNELLSDYFFIFLKCSEVDRYFWFHTDGSVRDGMSWEDFTDVEIELPPIEIQRKYVEIYKGMVQNQEAYETGLEDLKLSYEANIENLKKKFQKERIAPYIFETNNRNKDNLYSNVLGVCKEKKFIPTVANLLGISLLNYKVVYPNDFAYSNRINIGSIALRKEPPCLVSPSYTVFKIDEKKILPDYLMMWLCRNEFLHFAFFYSMGTIKDELSIDELSQLKIPIPTLEIQKFVVELFNVYNLRKEINEQLKQQIKNICPVLIKGAVEEAKRS
ncbi:MAG: restriction endonuclease subunit S [Prevotella sp.]|nr:restriction endonuclease subunit S [Prevotella sp.]